MSNNNPSDLDDLRKILSPEEFDKIIPDEILDQLKCSHCGVHLVAQFYDENNKFRKLCIAYDIGDELHCGYCKGVIANEDVDRQIKAIKLKQ